MSKSNFPGGFAGGMAVRNIPLFEVFPNKVFWVDSTNGSNSNKGTFERPFATIDYAIGRCTASKGDVIFVKPGHSETITGTDITVDVAGVSIIGLGNGALRPTISHNHANAEISIAADNVLWQNIRHRADVTAVAIGIEIEDGVDDTTIRGCLFDCVAAGTDEFNAAIHMVNDNTRTLIENNIIDMGIAGAIAGIHMDADTAFTIIQNNVIRGDYSTACIAGDTTLSTNLLIRGNLLENGIGGNLGTEPGIELLTGTTGTIADNYIVCNLATKAAAIVADTCLLFQNYYNEDISGSATGGIIGTASADDT
jgi:hypothetical protein